MGTVLYPLWRTTGKRSILNSKVAYKPEFEERLKEIDGMRIMDIPDEQWERLDIYAEFSSDIVLRRGLDFRNTGG